MEREVDQLFQTELVGVCKLMHWALILSQLTKDLLNTVSKQGVMPSAGGKQQMNRLPSLPSKSSPSTGVIDKSRDE